MKAAERAMWSYDEAVLLRELSLLPSRAQSAFAQACAWRTVNSLSEDGSEELRSLCIAVLDVVERGGGAAASKLLLDLEDHEELDHDCLSACVYVLRHTLNGDAQEAAWAARRAYEAADQIAQESFSWDHFTSEVEARLLAHPRVQWELARQGEDLEVLRSSTEGCGWVVARAKRVSAP